MWGQFPTIVVCVHFTPRAWQRFSQEIDSYVLLCSSVELAQPDSVPAERIPSLQQINCPTRPASLNSMIKNLKLLSEVLPI